MISVARRFFRNTGKSFTGKNALFHIGAIVSTYLLVMSGFDWFYFTHTQLPLLQIILVPAIVIGGLLPMFLPPILYVLGRLLRKDVLKTTAIALFQAAVTGSFISSFYKAFTGRVQPDLLQSAVDISHNFQFGFLEHGVFWGWPSSHTTIAFAMAITLIYLFPKNKFILYGALLYAFYIGIGISANIHWFSEFIAGALIGTAIGISVGKSFLVTTKSHAV